MKISRFTLLKDATASCAHTNNEKKATTHRIVYQARKSRKRVKHKPPKAQAHLNASKIVYALNRNLISMRTTEL